MRTYVPTPRGRAWQTGEPGFEPGLRGSKGLRLAIRPLPTAGTATVPPAFPLAVLVLVRYAARFAAFFVRWASWRDYAEYAHCLQSEGEAFAAVG